MSRPRSSALLRGLAPLGATVALLVGVPTGLAALVGWPLPTSLPDGDALSRALNTGISDEFIVNTLAVIAWLAWTQLARSEEHTSELQSLMRISYAVFCLKKKKT